MSPEDQVVYDAIMGVADQLPPTRLLEMSMAGASTPCGYVHRSPFAPGKKVVVIGSVPFVMEDA